MGSVRCSHCWKTGHNRTSCPELKKYVEENPDSYYAKRKRRADQKRAEGVKNRKCSWCKEPGHTRRTCSDLKTQIEKEAANSRIWNKGFLDALKSHGLGIGSLLRISSYEQDPERLGGYIGKTIASFGGLGIVIRIDEKECVSDSGMRDPLIVRGASGIVRRVPFPYEISKEFYKYAYRGHMQIEVVGKIDDHKVATSFSQKWLDGTIGARTRLRLDL